MAFGPYALGIILVVKISHMVRVYACKLRLAVEHHQHRRGPVAPNTAHLDMARASVADAEAEYAPLGDKEARHLARYGRQELRGACGIEAVTGNNTHGVGQEPWRKGGIRAGDHHLVEHGSSVCHLGSTAHNTRHKEQ